MAKKPLKELLERDAKRDIWQEALDAIIDIKAGRYGAVYQVPVSPVVEARHRASLSQTQFAALLGVHACPRQHHFAHQQRGRLQPPGASLPSG